jgi:hypothetical protein
MKCRVCTATSRPYTVYFTRSIVKETIARLVLCLGMQESTGDLKLNVPSGRSQVYAGVSESVLADLTRMAKYFHLPPLS